MMRARPLLLLLAVLAVLAVLAGCGEPVANATANDAVDAGHPGDRKEQTMTMIDIDAGTRRWTARIVDSPSARDFLAQLPLTLTLEDYGATEKIATLPKKLTRDGAPAAVTPRRGEIGYYAPWGNIALYYGDGPHSPGLVILGRMDAPYGDLAGTDAMRVTIRRQDTGEPVIR